MLTTPHGCHPSSSISSCFINGRLSPAKRTVSDIIELKLITKESKPSQWWNAVKRISGMAPASGPDSLLSTLQFEGVDNLSQHEVANMINNAL